MQRLSMFDLFCYYSHTPKANINCKWSGSIHAHMSSAFPAHRLYSMWRSRARVDASQYLQWTTIGPAVGGLEILTRRMNDNSPVAWYGTPWSGQPVKWNCLTSRTSLKPLCENKNIHKTPEHLKNLMYVKSLSAITLAPKSWIFQVTLMIIYHSKCRERCTRAKKRGL